MMWGQQFGRCESGLCRLVSEHRELEDEPLHLAIAYGPEWEPNPLDPHRMFVLEVITTTGTKGTIGEHDLFEMVFWLSDPCKGLPSTMIHLVLTNPGELSVALRDGWPCARQLLGAIRAGDYRVLHADEIGRTVLAALAEACEKVFVERKDASTLEVEGRTPQPWKSKEGRLNLGSDWIFP